MENKKLICKNCGKEIIPCNWLGHGIRHGDLKCKGYIHLKGPYYHRCDFVNPSAEIYPVAEIDTKRGLKNGKENREQ